ncbi:hypothetical protein ACJX0J_037481, partial [Zea mays]
PHVFETFTIYKVDLVTREAGAVIFLHIQRQYRIKHLYVFLFLFQTHHHILH